MNSLTIDLDSLTAARAEAYTAFLLGLADAQRGAPAKAAGPLELDLSTCDIGPLPTDPALSHPIFVTNQQARDMDETAGLAPSSAIPPAPAPSIAAAAPLPTAPEAQQDGAPATPSASTPPAPPVPMPPVPPAPASTGSPVLDAAGLPWDERIHSGAKSFNKDGTWRALRNMSDTEKAAVPGIEAELRQRVSGKSSAGQQMGQPTNAPLTSQTENSGVPGVSTAVVTSNPAAPAASAPPLPPAPPAPAPTAPAPAGTADASDSPAPANAIELTMKVTKLGNLLGADELQRACASVGLPDTPQAMLYLFAEAQKDPTLVGRLNAEIDEILAS